MERTVSQGFRVKKARVNVIKSKRTNYSDSFLANKNLSNSTARAKKINRFDKKYQKKFLKYESKIFKGKSSAQEAENFLRANTIKVVKRKTKPFKVISQAALEILKANEDDENLATEGVFKSVKKSSDKTINYFYEKRKANFKKLSSSESKIAKYQIKNDSNKYFYQKIEASDFELLNKNFLKRYLIKKESIKEYKMTNGLTFFQRKKSAFRSKINNLKSNLNEILKPIFRIFKILQPLIGIFLIFILLASTVEFISYAFSTVDYVSKNLKAPPDKKITIDEAYAEVKEYKDILLEYSRDLKNSYPDYRLIEDFNLQTDFTNITAYLKVKAKDKMNVSSELYDILDKLFITNVKVNESKKYIIYKISITPIDELAKKALTEAELKIYNSAKSKLEVLPGTKIGVVIENWEDSITSPFGWRANVFTNTGQEWHTGIDIAKALGTPVYAYSDGVITYARWNNYGYGNLIIIEHNGRIETYYAHLNTFHVKEGDKVFKGQHIADMGTTGYSTGPHLHFEYRIDNEAVNPYPYLKKGEKNE